MGFPLTLSKAVAVLFFISVAVQFLYYFCFVYHAGGPLDFGTADKISIFELLDFLLNNDEKEKESSRSIV